MADTSTLTGAVIIGALVYKLTDLVKYARAAWGSTKLDGNKRKKLREDGVNGLWTLGSGFLVGEVAMVVAWWTGLADQLTVGSTTLGDLPWPAKIVVGAALTAVAGLLYDGKKAIDGSETSSTPRMTQPAEEDRQQILAAKNSR